MTTWITICDTCKHENWDAGNCEKTDGEVLAELIEAEAGQTIKTRRHSCLMGCTRACNITIQADGKQNYTLGNFEANITSAKAIVEYAKLHADSEMGQVPFRNWPQEIKGHFVTRHPPLPKTQ